MKSIDQISFGASGTANGSGFLPLQPLARFDPHAELQFAIDAVDALVVPAKPFDVPQIQKAQAEGSPMSSSRSSAYTSNFRGDYPWLKQYNEIRPHEAVGMRPPVPETI